MGFESTKNACFSEPSHPLSSPIPTDPDPPDASPVLQHPGPNGSAALASPGASKSFKDCSVGSSNVDHVIEAEDWITTKMVIVDFLDSEKTVPKITFSKHALDVLSRPWRKALVVKLLSKSISY